MANIAGSALGTIVTGVVALGWLGAAATLKMLLLVSALFHTDLFPKDEYGVPRGSPAARR